MDYYRYNTPIGRLCIGEEGGCIVRVGLDIPQEACARERETVGIREAYRQIAEYLAGERTAFDLPLQIVGTPFQREVWACLRRIPYGQTWTYKEIAQMMGRPQACRAVGMACHRNPLLLLVPCHRVLGSGGALGGFVAGIAVKRALLRLEDSDNI